MADKHNDIAVQTKKKKKSNKMLASCFPSAFRLNCFYLLCSTIWGGERGERDLSRKRLLVFKTYGNCCCDTTHLILSGWITEGKIFTRYFRYFMPLHALRREPCRRVLNAPLVAGKSKIRKGGQASYTPFSLYVPSLSHTPFLATQSFLRAPAPNFSQNT